MGAWTELLVGVQGVALMRGLFPATHDAVQLGSTRYVES
jgi:hypothetical protein